MTCDNNYYAELARLEDERDVALAQATLAREAYQKFQSYIDWKELREQLDDERKHRLALQDTLDTWQKQIRTLQSTLHMWLKRVRLSDLSDYEHEMFDAAYKMSNGTQTDSNALQDQVEAAFKAGYHCSWHREQGVYCFDPAMSPGDPDSAYKAWLATLQVGP